MFELSWYCRDMGNSRQPFSARLVRNEPDIGRCSLTPRPLSTIRLRGCGSRHLDRPWPGASSRTVRLPVVKTELVVPPERVSARRRRHGSSARSPWSSTSPPLMRAPFVRGRARSRPTWRARSIGRAGTAERRLVPRRHGDAQGVALAIAATAAAKLPLEVEQPGVRRPAVLQQLRVDVGPLSAGGTGRDDHMPGAQIIEPDGIARRDVLALFHSSRAMPEQAREQGPSRLTLQLVNRGATGLWSCGSSTRPAARPLCPVRPRRIRASGRLLRAG